MDQAGCGERRQGIQKGGTKTQHFRSCKKLKDFAEEMDGDDESDVSAASKEFVDVGDDMEINNMFL